ncbi:MAG: F-type H+-transporting ATPase subunit b [Desulfovibrionales bacterium]|nr:F-type H+-transporting ATPase subunit b [Desulfovibrionales bacterium]
MKRVSIIIWTVLIVALCAATAFASEGGGGEHHALPWMNFILRWINFIIFVGLIWYLAGKKIKDFFVGRQKGIKKDLEDLDQRRIEADKQLKEVEQSIANIEQEKQAIMDKAREDGEAAKAAIIAKAKESAEKIRAQAVLSAEHETQAAIDALRADMADMVVAAAAKILEEKLDQGRHEKLVDEYIKKVVLN